MTDQEEDPSIRLSQRWGQTTTGSKVEYNTPPCNTQPATPIANVQARPSVQPNTSIVIHRQEGGVNRPDSISFEGSTKTPGLKIYVNFEKPEEVTDLIDVAFVGYGYALSKFMQMKADKPQLFPQGAGK
jgi:hypothetical protein